ncbi:MAG: mannonate dehydratase [Anaerolineae bacterium]|jgi:mannonate dehydratase
MKIGVRSNDGAADRLLFAQQIGADGASIWAAACPGYEERCYLAADDVAQMRRRFAKYDLELTGIGLGGECIKNQLLGLPGREAEIENVCRTIRSIGQAYADGAPAPVVIIDQRTTYWANGGPWWHPGYERLPLGRGGALLTTFDVERIQGELDDRPAGEVSREEVWSRIAYFYERVVPVAEEARVRLATHPDDPPLATYRGVEQALISFEGLKRLVDLVDSPYNGLLLCLGCMQEAGEDVPQVIRYFGQQGKIFYVHFRNVIGRVPKYREVLPHEGEGDMVANLRALKEVGYEGYVVPDHHIGLAGDDEWMRSSRAWQVGYIRGLMQALGI